MHASFRFPSSLVRCRSALLLLTLAAAGCEDEAIVPRSAPPGQIPEHVTVLGKDMQSGFAGGPLTQRRTLATYRITKHPITSSELEACVLAGACSEPQTSGCSAAGYTPYYGYDHPKYAQKGASKPTVCVDRVQADAYCKWIGGRLPTLDEWLLAARGDTPRRYSWGDKPSACDQHPMAPQLLRAPRHNRCPDA